MRVVIAPDKFRGTLSAPEAASAMAAGWRRVDLRAWIDELPVADGGEGTLEALAGALNAEIHRARVTGPVGDPVTAAYAVAATAHGLVGIVEMAQASGLRRVSEARRDPLRATTRGTGELLLEALAWAPSRLVVAVGGSATTDGGAGMAQALGVRLLDERGRDLRPGGGALRELARIDATELHRPLRSVDVVVAADVDSPLLGPDGAARAFGPQKGAGPDAVALLEEGLGHLAAVIHRDLGLDVRDVRGGAAAGGLGAGLVAFLGARVRPGFEVVAEAVDLPRRLEVADVVITGEGRYDRASERGKAPAGVLRMAREAGCRSVLIAGSLEGGAGADADVVYSLAEREGEDLARSRAAEAVADAAADAAARLREEA